MTTAGQNAPGPNAPDPNRSCLNCPSYLTPQEFGKRYPSVTNPGVPVCAAKNRILADPNQINVTKQFEGLVQIANDCDYYGQDGPPGSLASLPGWTIRIGTNDSAWNEASHKASSPDRDFRATSCRACRFFEPANQASTDLGMPGPVCHAMGSVILSTTGHAAKQCNFSMPIVPTIGTYSYQSADLSLFPDLVDSAPAADPYQTGVPVFTVPTVAIEPTTYPSDYQVDPEDAAEGIRAWRKIADPRDPRRMVLMPIFDRAFFTPDEAAKIPNTGDDEHPELYIDYSEAIYKVLVLWLELDETPAVWGAAGVGKTELFRHLAWMMQLPFERISITATSETDDLAGKMLYSPEHGTHFQYGRIPKAWTKPSVICLDEPNVGPDEVWEFIRPLTDNSKQLVLDVNAGERIARHKFCYMGMAMNPAWDTKNIGTQSVADADSSRLMHLYIANPPQGVEAKIIQDRLALDGWQLSDKSLTQVMVVADDIRQLCNEGTLPITWGVRHQIKATRALKWFQPPEAYAIACADFLEPAHRDIILDLVKSTIETV